MKLIRYLNAIVVINRYFGYPMIFGIAPGSLNINNGVHGKAKVEFGLMQFKLSFHRGLTKKPQPSVCILTDRKFVFCVTQTTVYQQWRTWKGEGRIWFDELKVQFYLIKL
jgi:hypothetical protein